MSQLYYVLYELTVKSGGGWDGYQASDHCFIQRVFLFFYVRTFSSRDRSNKNRYFWPYVGNISHHVRGNQNTYIWRYTGTFPAVMVATKTHIFDETSRHFLAMIRAIKTGIFDHTLEDFQPTKTHISWEIGIYLTRCSPLCEGIMNRMFFDETSGHFPGVLGP